MPGSGTTLYVPTLSPTLPKHEKLTEQEYRTIEVIGASTEYLTLSIVDPDKYLQNWENVMGPDKSIAVVADIYTRNVLGCPKDGILHVATGKSNSIMERDARIR